MRLANAIVSMILCITVTLAQEQNVFAQDPATQYEQPQELNDEWPQELSDSDDMGTPVSRHCTRKSSVTTRDMSLWCQR
jgi:uncharacterized protein YdeI (BOF family)